MTGTRERAAAVDIEGGVRRVERFFNSSRHAWWSGQEVGAVLDPFGGFDVPPKDIRAFVFFCLFFGLVVGQSVAHPSLRGAGEATVLSGEGDGRVEREGLNSVEKRGMMDVDRVLRNGEGARLIGGGYTLEVSSSPRSFGESRGRRRRRRSSGVVGGGHTLQEIGCVGGVVKRR